jgi:hypothetical protein
VTDRLIKLTTAFAVVAVALVAAVVPVATASEARHAALQDHQ